jgi:dynein intermediate chain 1|tara:strand:- start:3431 stop:3934 length:504 start_codon:yes stop_codon:yes gene_type:complete
VNHPARDRSSETEPPATSDFGGAATQWNIYDAYMEDQHRLALQKEMQKKQKQQAKDAAQGGDESGKNANAGDAADARLKKKPELMASLPMTKAVRVMERMVNQNSYDDIAQDFKYWEDQSDQFREGEGTLLPLWKVSKYRLPNQEPAHFPRCASVQGRTPFQSRIHT